MAFRPSSHVLCRDVIAPPGLSAGRVGVPQAVGACRSLLIPLRRPVRGDAACKFLFFPRRMPLTRLLRPTAAAQHLLVNINENTSAGVARRDGSVPQPTESVGEKGAHRRLQCNTSMGKTSRTAIELETGTRARGTRHAAVPSTLTPRRARAAIVNPCRSLLIQRLPPAEPVRSGCRRGRRHGHRPVRPPPSRLLESGGRP
jgi:hypothetical protein